MKRILTNRNVLILRTFIIIGILVLHSCLVTAQADVNTRIDNSFRDTNTYAVLPAEQYKHHFFDSTSSASVLTLKEIEIIEVLFFKAIKDYNERMTKEIDSIYKDPKENLEQKNDYLIPIQEEFYLKQLFPIINKKGEKEVYIHCFQGKPDGDFWKKEFIGVSGGGNNLFHLTVNITQGTFYDININGYC